MRYSSGILLYRRINDKIEVLIVHPSGNYNHNAPWSIPKGMPEKNEDLESAARREVKEETGIVVPSQLVSIGSVDLRSKKRIYCFVGEATQDMIPTIASWENDAVKFVPTDEAKNLLHPMQIKFVDRLLQHLK